MVWIETLYSSLILPEAEETIIRLQRLINIVEDAFGQAKPTTEDVLRERLFLAEVVEKSGCSYFALRVNVGRYIWCRPSPLTLLLVVFIT